MTRFAVVAVCALFLATATSISALPVIAKTLMDITRTFRHEEIRQKAAEVRTYTEFLVMIRTQSKV